MAGRVHRLYRKVGGGGGGGGACVWTAAPRQVQAAEVNDCMLRQTLCSSLALRDAVSEKHQRVDAVLKWRLQLQATY